MYHEQVAEDDEVTCTQEQLEVYIRATGSPTAPKTSCTIGKNNVKKDFPQTVVRVQSLLLM